MKALILCGSQRKNSSTMAALKVFGEEMSRNNVECEIFQLPDEPIKGCNGCRACKNTRRCVTDDLVNTLIPKALDCDCLILASPVYYASPNGAFLALLDRLFYCVQDKMAFKVGASIACARRSGTTATFDVLNKYFLISNMIVAGSQYWNNVHGNSPQEVMQDAEGIQTVKTLANNISYILSIKEFAEKNGMNPPEIPMPIRTNFIR